MCLFHPNMTFHLTATSVPEVPTGGTGGFVTCRAQGCFLDVSNIADVGAMS